MTREEFRQNAAISALQGVVEAKYGVFLEIADDAAALLALRLAESLTDKYFEKYPEQL